MHVVPIFNKVHGLLLLRVKSGTCEVVEIRVEPVGVEDRPATTPAPEVLVPVKPQPDLPKAEAVHEHKLILKPRGDGHQVDIRALGSTRFLGLDR